MYVVSALVYKKMTRDPSFEAFTHIWSGTAVWIFSGTGSYFGLASRLMGRVDWTAGWFLPAVPHPVVVWEVVVNTDGEMWSYRDGFSRSGPVWSGLVGSGWDGGVLP